MSDYLAIGCGGTIGGAWIVAALHHLEQQTGWDPRSAELLQGTSAGAEMVTILTGGGSVDDLVAMQREAGDDPRLSRHLDATPPSVPPIPRPGLPAASLLLNQRGHARLPGLLPQGRGDATWLQHLSERFLPDGALPARARMVAVNTATGQRVAFGDPASPRATAGEALRASWAIPGWMPPVVVDGDRYVDGGAASTASVDLVPAGAGDTVYVIAPMASAPGERVPGLGGLAEQLVLRGPMSSKLHREVAEVRARGARVVLITPDRDDLAGLGPHFMNRNHRREAFESSMRTAERTVAAALAS